MKLGHLCHVDSVFLTSIVVVEVYVDGFISFQAQLFDKRIADRIKRLCNGFSVVAVRSPLFFADEVFYDIPIQLDRKGKNRVCRW